MATMGLKYCAWAKMKEETKTANPTYFAGKVIGKAVSANLTVTNAEAELAADDMIAEYVREFSSANLAMEVDNIDLADQAQLYGAKYENEELQHFADDNAPYGGIGGYQVLLVQGVRKYRAWVFPKAKAAVPDWTGTTKGSSITLGTQPINLKIVSPNCGPWYRVKEFDTEAAAQAYVDSKLNVEEWYQMNIQVNGVLPEGSTLSSGVVYAPAGEDFVLEIAGTPAALYDNGVEKTSAVTEGKYILSAVAANHDIAVIYNGN